MNRQQSVSYREGYDLGMQPLPRVCPGDFFDPAIPANLIAADFRIGFMAGLVDTLIRTRAAYSATRVWHTEA